MVRYNEQNKQQEKEIEMGMFGEDRIDEINNKIDGLDASVQAILKAVSEIKEVDTAAVVRSVQASFNGIKASNENNVNRIHNLMTVELDKRIGKAPKTTARIDSEKEEEKTARKTRITQTIKHVDEDE